MFIWQLGRIPSGPVEAWKKVLTSLPPHRVGQNKSEGRSESSGREIAFMHSWEVFLNPKAKGTEKKKSEGL